MFQLGRLVDATGNAVWLVGHGTLVIVAVVGAMRAVVLNWTKPPPATREAGHDAH